MKGSVNIVADRYSDNQEMFTQLFLPKRAKIPPKCLQIIRKRQCNKDTIQRRKLQKQ